MNESILFSIKKLLGIAIDDESFDTDIIIYINSVLNVCTQLGIGPADGFTIKDDTTTWEDFITTFNSLEVVKSYIAIRVRLLFDPPTNSFLVDNLEKQAREFEWRLTVMMDEENNKYN